MVEAICVAVAGLIGIAAIILKQYYGGKKERDEKAREEEIQQGRRDIAGGNVDAVSERIDKLLSKSNSDPA